MTYTKDQLLQHGELILKYINNPEIKVQSRLTPQHPWEDRAEPKFSKFHEYREKAKPDFVNDLGEEFYKNTGSTAFFYNLTSEKMVKVKLDCTNNKEHRIGKTRLSALKLAVMQLEKPENNG